MVQMKYFFVALIGIDLQEIEFDLDHKRFIKESNIARRHSQDLPSDLLC